MVLNVIGAAATGATLCVVLASKFTHGAWIALVLTGGMLVLFRQVRSHYDFITRATATEASLAVGPSTPPIAVLPIRRWDAVTLKAMSFAIGVAPEVIAVQVLTQDRDVDDLTARWATLVTKPAEDLGIKAPRLVVLRSEFRQVLTPLLDFVTELKEQNPDRQVAVIVPELVEARWYHYLLHNHTAAVIKALLLFRGGPQVVIVSTPWHLSDWIPEHRRLQRLRKSAMVRWLAHRWAPGRRG